MQLKLEQLDRFCRPCQWVTSTCVYYPEFQLYKKYILYTWNFSWHVYFTVKHETRIFAVEISRMKVIQKFSHFSRLAVRKMYGTNLSEIDKTLYQIVYHSRGNPRPPCGKSWESALSPVGQSKWTDNITMNY